MRVLTYQDGNEVHVRATHKGKEVLSLIMKMERKNRKTNVNASVKVCGAEHGWTPFGAID